MERPRYHLLGICRHGDRCRYSHEVVYNNARNAPDAPNQNAHSTPVVGRTQQGSSRQQGESMNASNTQAQLRTWRLNIPQRDPIGAPKLYGGLAAFFQQGEKLGAAESSVTQEVITALASEGGLRRIAELVDRDFDALPDTRLSIIFADQAVPFFRLLAHKNVDRSAFLESRLVTIYTFLFGINGHRTITLLKAAARYLTPLVKPGGAEQGRIALESTLLVFTKIVDTNATAHITEPLKPIVELFAALLPPSDPEEEPFSRAGSKYLRKIQQRFNMGERIPIAGAAAPLTTVEKATFFIPADLPGTLSDDGPRHDNDHVHIRNVKIMPTLQEIFAARNEYLPTFDPADWHIPDLAGLLDRQFRLVREDSVGNLRDAAKAELERLQNPLNTAELTSSARHGTRTFVYQSVQFKDFGFDNHKGLEFAISFDQPPEFRKLGHAIANLEKAWSDSKRLENDALVCLINAQGAATFLMVSTPFESAMDSAKKSQQSHRLHEVYPRFAEPNRVCAVVRFVEHNQSIAKQVVSFFDGHKYGAQMSLVEFPGVLVPAFLPTLQALQKMSSSLDLPFADLILQSSNSDTPNLLVPPPSYATALGFVFDLQSVANGVPTTLKVNMDGSLRSDLNVQEFLDNTSLDPGQAQALISSLTRSFAITQGPPGTGKSYTGVALIKVLLASKSKDDTGPIVLVSYTNHALDQMLEHLLDAGVKQIIRIGSRSRSERLSELNLRKIAHAGSNTKAEKQEKWRLTKEIGEESRQLVDTLGQLVDLGSQNSVDDYLRSTDPGQWKQLFGLEDEDGFTMVDHHPETRMLRWLNGQLFFPTNEFFFRPMEEILETDLRALSLGERALVHGHWISQIRQRLENSIGQSLQKHHELKEQLELVRSELNLRALEKANVVGVTTSGLARNLNLLRKLSSKILVSEEAGEIQEAQLLTALLPSLEHVILIGDHLQLRPQIANYSLSSESQEGKQYCLDISLFERLVKPLTGTASALPFSTLTTQRRMHPQISQLVRSTLYPQLLDSPTVMTYPEIPGMRRRLFWLDHAHLEDAPGPDSQSLSKTNTWEADMTAALVRHIIRQGVYKPSEVAVLTPYLGQLRVLRDKLKSYYEITLSERDSIEVGDQPNGGHDAASESSSDVDENAEHPKKRAQHHITEVTRGTLMDAIRLPTVDNFQGEEAKVVIISLVRSNEKKNPGFLRTENRCNVLVSRAMHGMYTIGNAATAATVPMWERILQLLEPDCIGEKLELCCPRHPLKIMEAGEPEELVKLSPAGGCEELCSRRLDCGHACPQPCHSDILHQDVYCQKDCTRTMPECDHPCPNRCGAACPARCEVIIRDWTLGLECGHQLKEPPCWKTRQLDKLVCTEPVMKQIPGCGHEMLLPCHVDPTAPGFVCKAKCDADLLCGHSCTAKCNRCHERKDGVVVNTAHESCNVVCSRDYKLCKHSCQKICHEGEPCPPCNNRCTVTCSHSQCSQRCNEPCTPCAEELCTSRCEHAACEMPCAAPCDWIPCSQRCSKTLSCGCRCPSVCGEPCPLAKYCQDCGTEEVRKHIVDYLEFEEYQDVDLDVNPVVVLNCGHFFTMSTLDGIMGISDFYNVDEDGIPTSLKATDATGLAERALQGCPSCRGSMRNIARYGRIVRRALLDESTKKFISWSNAEYIPLAQGLFDALDTLDRTTDEAKPIKGAMRLVGDRNAQIKEIHSMGDSKRYGHIFSARRMVLGYVQKVQKAEQPFQRVRDMVEVLRRKKAGEGTPIAPFDFDQSLLQTRASSQGLALLLRCDLGILSDALALRGKGGIGATGGENKAVEVDLTANRTDCEKFIEDTNRSKHPALEAEGHLFWARFAALDLATSSEAGLRTEAIGHLDAAEAICAANPSQTRAVAHEIEPSRKMVTDATFYSAVSSDEMRAVVAAMANEFQGTGHWYTCVNGHLFTIGECGMPMETSRCPQCGESVGGNNNHAVEGVTRAHEVDDMLADLEI